MSRNASLALFLAFVFVIFFSVNILAQALLRTAQLDLTENELFTLSDGTKEVLNSLPDTVTLRFYFSEDLAARFPSIDAYGKRVRDMLEEYQRRSDSRINLEVVHPEPFSEAEDEAVAEGLTGVPLNNGNQLYFGLVGTDTTDRKEVIEFFDQSRERFLEYDLTQLVQNLSQTARPMVGVLSSLPLDVGPGGMQAAMQGQSQPFTVWKQLNQSFNVTRVSPDFNELNPDLDILMIVNPGQLGDDQLFAVDQFALRGGRVIAFLDPHSETAGYMQGVGNRPIPTSSSLGPLLDAWGVTFDTSEVVADRALAQPVQTGQGGSVVNYVLWLRPGEGNLSGEDLVTAELNSMLLATAGYFTQADDSALTFEPLITSSEQSTIMPTTDLSLQPDPQTLLRDFRPSGQRFVMAARVTGMAETAFPDGPPQLETEATTSVDVVEAQDLPKGELLSGSKEPLNVILVADSDMLDDRFWVQTQRVLGETVAVPTADNGAFVLNAVENLSGSQALISLRSRGTSDRPFTVVNELRREAEQQYLAEEQRLQEKLDRTQQQIAEMQNERADGGLFLTPEQQNAIATYREQAIETRRQLRDVQRRLREDIDALTNTLRIINIVLMPALVAVLAVTLGMARRRRHQRSRGQA